MDKTYEDDNYKHEQYGDEQDEDRGEYYIEEFDEDIDEYSEEEDGGQFAKQLDYSEIDIVDDEETPEKLEETESNDTLDLALYSETNLLMEIPEGFLFVLAKNRIYNCIKQNPNIKNLDIRYCEPSDTKDIFVNKLKAEFKDYNIIERKVEKIKLNDTEDIQCKKVYLKDILPDKHMNAISMADYPTIITKLSKLVTPTETFMLNCNLDTVLLPTNIIVILVKLSCVLRDRFRLDDAHLTYDDYLKMMKATMLLTLPFGNCSQSMVKGLYEHYTNTFTKGDIVCGAYDTTFSSKKMLTQSTFLAVVTNVYATTIEIRRIVLRQLQTGSKRNLISSTVERIHYNDLLQAHHILAPLECCDESAKIYNDLSNPDFADIITKYNVNLIPKERKFFTDTFNCYHAVAVIDNVMTDSDINFIKDV